MCGDKDLMSGNPFSFYFFVCSFSNNKVVLSVFVFSKQLLCLFLRFFIILRLFLHEKCCRGYEKENILSMSGSVSDGCDVVVQ